MVLCSFCENITIDGIAVDYDPSLQRWEEPPGYNHAPDYPALLAYISEACVFDRRAALIEHTSHRRSS